MNESMEFLGYVPDPCPNCGRIRVMKFSNRNHICEKCNWIIGDEEYFDWDEYYEELLRRIDIL